MPFVLAVASVYSMRLQCAIWLDLRVRGRVKNVELSTTVTQASKALEPTTIPWPDEGYKLLIA